MGLRWRPGTCHWGLTFQESTKVDKSNQGEEWDGHTELWLSHLPTTMIASWCVGKSTENCFFSLLSCRLKSGGGNTLPKVGSLIRAENLFCTIILSLRHWLKQARQGDQSEGRHPFWNNLSRFFICGSSRKRQKTFPAIRCIVYTPISWFDLEWTLNWSIEIPYKSLCDYRTQWMHRAECLACCCRQDSQLNKDTPWVKVIPSSVHSDCISRL